MSEQQQPKEHCEHECVCSLYGVECWYGKHKTDKSEPCDMSGVLTRPCKHDTRSRPHPAPQAPDVGVTNPFNIADYKRGYHEGAAKERERVLDAFSIKMRQTMVKNGTTIRVRFSRAEILEWLESLRDPKNSSEFEGVGAKPNEGAK